MRAQLLRTQRGLSSVEVRFPPEGCECVIEIANKHFVPLLEGIYEMPDLTDADEIFLEEITAEGLYRVFQWQYPVPAAAADRPPDRYSPERQVPASGILCCGAAAARKPAESRRRARMGLMGAVCRARRRHSARQP